MVRGPRTECSRPRRVIVKMGQVKYLCQHCNSTASHAAPPNSSHCHVTVILLVAMLCGSEVRSKVEVRHLKCVHVLCSRGSAARMCATLAVAISQWRNSKCLAVVKSTNYPVRSSASPFQPSAPHCDHHRASFSLLLCYTGETDNNNNNKTSATA